MPPEELPPQSQPARPPHPRRPVSIDGFSPAPIRRPIMPAPGGQRPVYLERPAPVSQPVPPVAAPIPVPPPVAPAPAPVPAAPAPAPAVPTPASFTPPPVKKSRRRLILKIVLSLLLVIALAAGITSWFRYQARQNDPALAFREALINSLSITQVQAAIESPAESSQVIYDFSKPEEPLISNQATIQFSGSNFDVKAYGSPKNTYISYTKLPASITPVLQTTILDSWVRIRANGALPANANAMLANLADPRYQAFGLLVFGNFPEQTRDQLTSFIEAHQVYKYDPAKITKKTVDGSEVLAYPVTLNVDYLKIANQSAAASEKFPPGEVQAAVDALEAFKGAKATIYISVKEHRVQQLDITTDEGTTTIKYSHYNKPAIPGEPPTKLVWKDFAPAQAQLEAQAEAAATQKLDKKP